MRSKAALIWGVGADWSVEDIEIDDPKPGEVLVRMHYAGLCHSDEHVRTGDFSAPPEWGLHDPIPCIGGHEGAGVVEAVGDGVTSVRPGDHVAASFIPSCGVCPPCSTGHQNLCDLGAELMAGTGMISDHTWRHHARGRDVNAMALLGTYSEWMVAHEHSLVKVEPHHPLEAVALVSCGVATGWGSSVNQGEVRAGDTVVVVGVGGIGINAVQGARHAGATTIIAVDPVAMKRETAQQLGATHSAASMEECFPLLQDLSLGRMANTVVLSVGTVTGDLVAPAMSLVGKMGKLVVTGVAPMTQMDVQLNLLDLGMMEKQIRGTVFGSCNPRADIPRLLRLYEQGVLELDALITARYPLADINAGYADMHAGKNVRGILELA